MDMQAREAEMRFVDRVDAGQRLAVRLGYLRGQDLVVLGLPRGGVPVALEVAEALDAPLDVILVRKLGVPFQPELAMGAIGEGGVRVLNAEVLRLADVSAAELAAVERRERAELERRALRFRGGQPPVPLGGRTVIIVDDGIATGSTAKAACEVARAQGAARIVLATAVAPPDWTARLAGAADEFVCVATPDPFFGVGQFYRDFSQTTDDEVIRCLDRARQPATAVAGDTDDPPLRDEELEVDAGGVRLGGRLTVPERPVGAVVFAHGSGSSRRGPRNRLVASRLNEAGLATLLLDLLTPDESARRELVFDVPLLAGRLTAAVGTLRGLPEGRLPVGLFGASTGAAAALWAAAEMQAVSAIVSRGGRPDLARPRLALVTAPTLLIVGGADPDVLALNRAALAELQCRRDLVVIPGANHLFGQPGALDRVAEHAGAWFRRYLGRQ